ncbi:MAG: restriction endonuclease subunit S [Gammaproteobacteria bacterium]|nr:restriction endonuclease subunit S [Gammaproteobacteria bacterium]
MVRAGYKQTEVGEIPEDWSPVLLGSISISEGGYAFSSKSFEKEGVFQVVKMSNLYGGVLQLKRSASFLNKLNALEKRYLIAKNNILITLTGTVGKFDYGYSHIVREETKLLLNQRVARIIVNEKEACPVFIGYLCKTPIFLRQFYDLSKGGTGNQTNVSTSDLLSVELPFPKQYKEQKAIAKALSDVDALIASLDKLIAKKRDIKTATMQQLLTGKLRLPGFGEGKGYKQTGLGEIPEDWEVEKIGRNFSVTAGGDLRKSEYSKAQTSDHLYPIYSNAITGKGIYGFGSTFDYQGQYITITARGGIGHAEARDGGFCAIGRLIVLNPIEKLNCNYLTEFINQYVSFANESTGVPQLTAPQVSQYSLALPTCDEQCEIAKVLSDMDSDIEALIAQSVKTKAIKQGMMQELLTGRTRLVDAAATSKTKVA